MKATKNAPQKNGNVQSSKTLEIAKNSTNGKKDAILDQEKTAKKEEIKQEAKILISAFRPTAEERIKNMEKFQILTAKYDHLKAKKEELEKFKISSDGTKERIYFENSEGYKLEVSNSNIVNDMLALAENTLSEILNNTQNEVQEFVI